MYDNLWSDMALDCGCLSETPRCRRGSYVCSVPFRSPTVSRLPAPSMLRTWAYWPFPIPVSFDARE